jgi:hypothetical protein
MSSSLTIPPGALLKVGSFVVEKWSAWRRDQFYQSFLEALQVEQATGQRDQTVDGSLDYLLEDDTRGQIIYDAFRRVCFTKSRKYGPRIIGLLTGHLVNEANTASEEEEQVFAAAEKMGDGELVEFANYYRELVEIANDEKILKKTVMRSGNELLQIYNEEQQELGQSRAEAHLTPISPWLALGSWAGQLATCGMFEVTLTQETHLVREDSERHIDYDQRWANFITTFIYRSPCKRLFDLYERARGLGSESGAEFG